jgi:hypothetical protein
MSGVEIVVLVVGVVVFAAVFFVTAIDDDWGS